LAFLYPFCITSSAFSRKPGCWDADQDILRNSHPIDGFLFKTINLLMVFVLSAKYRKQKPGLFDGIEQICIPASNKYITSGCRKVCDNCQGILDRCQYY